MSHKSIPTHLTIKYAKFNGPNRVILSRMPIPICLPEFVLVKVLSSGICGSDLLMYSGIRDQPPHSPGHEFSGIVIEIGSLVHNISVGDRVCVEGFSHCGHCLSCRKGKYNLCSNRVFMPYTGPSGFSEIALVPASALHLLPREIDFELGSLVEPLAVGLHALNRLPARLSHDLLIIGSGTIGLCTLLCSKVKGFTNVWVMVKYPHQETLAHRYGATGVIHPHENILDVIGKEPTAIISTSTTAIALDQAITVCRRSGTIVLTGGFSSPTCINLRSMVSKEINIVGSIGYSTNKKKLDFQTIIEWIASGKIDPRSLITHRFSLDDIASAFATAQRRSCGSVKVNIQMTRKSEEKQ